MTGILRIAGLGAVAVAVFGLVSIHGSLGADGYVVFHKTFGDWVVLCSGASATAKRGCRLSAPPGRMAPGKAQNLLVVSEPTPDSFEVAIEVRDLAMAGQPAFIRIDGFAVHEGPVRRSRAVWRGERALRIVSEMRAGAAAVFRIQTMPDGLPRDTHVSLKGFRDALSAYRKAIRVHGVLSGS